MIRAALAGLAALLVSTSALAQSVPTAPYVDRVAVTTGVTALGMDVARTTSCMNVRGYRFLALDIALNRAGASTTALETKCSAYREAACADSIPLDYPVCTGSSCDQYKPSFAISASRGFPIRVDVAALDYFKCTVTPTTGAAGDLLTIRAYKSKE